MRFGLTIFASAFLLFLVQPLVSKAILPWFGGSAALWTTSLLFFQVLLLGGYAYAHALTWLPPRRQVQLHLALAGLALISLPIVPDAAWKPIVPEDPTWRVLGVLAATVGLPYFVLAGTGPLIQAWFAREQQAPPYRLYALSNLGSFWALLVYPFALQPLLGLGPQAWVWSVGYAGYAVALAWVGWLHHGAQAVSPTATAAAPPVAAPTRALWIALPACATALLLAVTTQVTQDVAVVPFLWVLPLGVYLLSFVVCFERDRGYRRGWAGPLVAAAMAGVWLALGPTPWVAERAWVVVGLYVGGLFVLCWALHGELARLKPAPGQATAFYLGISFGGALGGCAVGLGAPRLFATTLELPLGLVLAGALLLVTVARDSPTWTGSRRRAGLALGLGGLAVLTLGMVRREAEFRDDSVHLSRNFYGSLRVQELASRPGLPDRLRVLSHGRVCHGAQLLGRHQGVPVIYYGRRAGMGLALELKGQSGPLRVGALGLGVGAVAAYGRPGDTYRLYEIDPGVIEVAETLFTFVPDCAAEVTIVAGDARLSLEREDPQAFDVLVVDVFAGDAIPVHLLTREAFAELSRHLRADGVIAVHVTNDSSPLDLRPVVEAVAASHGFAAALIETPARVASGVLDYPSRWVLLSRDAAFLEHEAIRTRASPALAREARPWTDAWSSLLGALKR